MKFNNLDRMVMALVIGTLSLAGISIAADGQREPQEEQKRDQQEKQQEQKQQLKQQQQERVQKQSDQDQKQQQRRVQQEQKQDQRQQQKQQEQQQDRVQRKSEQDQKQQQQRVQQEQKQDQRQERQRDERGERQAEQQDRRISRQQQQQRINQQQQEVARYRQHLEQQESRAKQHSEELQRQKRTAQYRYQEEYLEHLRQQQIRLRNERFDYDRDPYFYAAPIYRYNRGGRYYEINRYGANVLRQALNAGYEQGFRAGEADRHDHWRASYRDSYAYRDANYGYSGYYVSRSEYNYYFREGFRRGTFCGRCVEYCATHCLHFEETMPPVAPDQAAHRVMHQVSYRPCGRCGRPVIPLPLQTLLALYGDPVPAGIAARQALCERCRGRTAAEGLRGMYGAREHE